MRPVAAAVAAIVATYAVTSAEIAVRKAERSSGLPPTMEFQCERRSFPPSPSVSDMASISNSNSISSSSSSSRQALEPQQGRIRPQQQHQQRGGNLDSRFYSTLGQQQTTGGSEQSKEKDILPSPCKRRTVRHLCQPDSASRANQ